MKKTLAAMCAAIVIVSGCDKLGGTKGKYEAIIKRMEKLSLSLQSREKNLNDFLLQGVTPQGSCEAVIGLSDLKTELDGIKKDLDAVMPKDMPMRDDKEVSGVSDDSGKPQRPVVETIKVVDLGKVTGTEQNLWATLYTAHLSLATATGAIAVGCQCVDGGDKNSIQCSLAAAQINDNSRFSLDLDSLRIMYLDPAREMIGKL